VIQSSTTDRVSIEVCGVVQGVGFRPFVYELATRLNLGGYVANCDGAVVSSFWSRSAPGPNNAPAVVTRIESKPAPVNPPKPPFEAPMFPPPPIDPPFVPAPVDPPVIPAPVNPPIIPAIQPANLLPANLLPASPRVHNPANGHDYQRIDKAMSWHEANDYCDSLGGHLATATSDAENQFLFKTFGQDHVIWLGATDEDEEGKWTWVTGEPWNYTSWMPGEPSNHGKKEHYLNMGNCPGVTFQGRNYFFRFGPKWNDHESSGDYWQTLICYPVCEWDK